MKPVTTRIFLTFFLTLVTFFAFSPGAQAAVYTVTNTFDSGAGSLREAISEANRTPAADDTITFSIPAGSAGCASGGVCTITLTGGELLISSIAAGGKLTIVNSSGADKLLISGNNQSRVFFVSRGAELTLDGVTVTEGNGIGNGESLPILTGGGGIYVNTFSTLKLYNSAVKNNSLEEFYQPGSGIYNRQGTVELRNSTVSFNSANGPGAGIYNRGILTVSNSAICDNTIGNISTEGAGIFNGFEAAATITDSTICRNLLFSGSGGGISNTEGNLTVMNSTLNDNGMTAGGSGGGIYNFMGNVTLRNTTVSGNRASRGGAIYNVQANNEMGRRTQNRLNLIGATITGNTAFGSWNPCQYYESRCATVGGVFNGTYEGPYTPEMLGMTVYLQNTIIAGNRAIRVLYPSDEIMPNPNANPDFVGFVSPESSYNLIGIGRVTPEDPLLERVTNGINGIANGTNNNQIGTQAAPLDARLAPLAQNGGSTWTHALLPDSPAIDRGSASGLLTDQRGFSRTVKTANYPNASDGTDIGAFETGLPDSDFDGVPDAADNCPLATNFNQTDNDGDKIGDVCDPDDDNDGVPDAADNAPLVPNADQLDFDQDGIADVLDPLIGPVKNTEQCKNGGWTRFNFPRRFNNQGDCFQSLTP